MAPTASGITFTFALYAVSPTAEPNNRVENEGSVLRRAEEEDGNPQPPASEAVPGEAL